MLGQFVTHARRLLNLLAAGMLLVACTSVLSMHATAAERIEVGFLAADNEESEFWGGMARLAAAVAEDLNVDLRIVYPRHEKFENDGMSLVNDLSEGADYHHGYDFADELGASFKTPMVPMSKEDVGRYLEKVGSSPDPDWSRIDFRRFTKTHNSGLKRYDFSWERIIEAL